MDQLEGLIFMRDLSACYRNRRVLITGHTGFKGSWLAHWLLHLGAEVHGIALEPQPEERLFELLGLDQRVNNNFVDIRQYDALYKAYSAIEPEFVFHLAAQPLVRLSYAEPKRTFDVNVSGSVNVLECVRESHFTKVLVFVTSDKCYENHEWIWGYRENDPLGGNDPYSASKAAAEIIFHSYFNSFFMARDGFGAASVRAGNVIGGGDFAMDRIIPDSVRALSAGQAITVRNPHATRPWQHVLEPLHGYLTVGMALGENPKKFSGSWNFGPETESVRDVASLTRTFIRVWGQGELHLPKLEGQPHEANLLHLNCDKARQMLKWRPVWDFETTIEKTAEWYLKHHKGQSVLELTDTQLQKFMTQGEIR